MKVLDHELQFWLHVRSSVGCWEFVATRNQKGYGRFSKNGRLLSAHRFSWELHFGPIPDGLLVLHKCDNPPCVRPDHLFLGTNDDNMADKSNKGRCHRPAGEKNCKAIITAAQVVQIRQLYDEKIMGASDIARAFEVSLSSIERIVYRKGWLSVSE